MRTATDYRLHVDEMAAEAADSQAFAIKLALGIGVSNQQLVAVASLSLEQIHQIAQGRDDAAGVVADDQLGRDRWSQLVSQAGRARGLRQHSR